MFCYTYSSKQMLKMAKKTLSEKITVNKKKHGRHKKESDGTDEAAYLLDLSRCNSYDFESAGRDIMVGGTAAGSGTAADHMMTSVSASGGGGLMKDTDTMFFRERHLVPVDTIRVGMGRFSFLLETCSPGSIPDPLMVSALLDLVRETI